MKHEQKIHLPINNDIITLFMISALAGAAFWSIVPVSSVNQAQTTPNSFYRASADDVDVTPVHEADVAVGPSGCGCCFCSEV